MPCDNQKLVIFDDYLNTGSKNDAEIRNYFTNSRNNCSCIYLSQSYYGTDKTICLDCTHHCIFEFRSSNEQNMICREPHRNHMISFMLISPKNVLPRISMKRYNLIYMYMSYSNGLVNFKSQTVGQGERGRPGAGLNLTSDENYDMVNKKLKNVADGTSNSDAFTKHQLDTAMIDKHDNNQNIDLKNTYNVINSKQQTFNEMNASRNTLVCYEDVRDVFVSRKESVFPMQTHLDMGNQFIHNVKTPVNNHQGANKSYVDQHIAKTGDTMSGDLNLGNKKISHLVNLTDNAGTITKAYVDTGFLKLLVVV